VLTVSRLGAGEKRKHVDKVIRAVAQLKGVLPGIVLDVVGEGELRVDLEALTRELGATDVVRFHGSVSEQRLREFYLSARVFALPSSKEGFGIVYLEAWQYGVPVICSIHGASPEIVSDGVDGFAVDEDDIPLLADRLKILLTDDEACRAFGERGRLKVSELYCNNNFRINLTNCINILRHREV
jgi:glycosyltransferase involved in cell wall biosynthesis